MYDITGLYDYLINFFYCMGNIMKKTLLASLLVVSISLHGEVDTSRVNPTLDRLSNIINFALTQKILSDVNQTSLLEVFDKTFTMLSTCPAKTMASLDWVKSNLYKITNKNQFIAMIIVLGPISTSYCIHFPPQEVMELIDMVVMQKSNLTNGPDVTPAVPETVQNLIVQAYNNPMLLLELSALGVLYKTVFTGLPFIMNKIVDRSTGVKSFDLKPLGQ
jgi:hypothetical protein